MITFNCPFCGKSFSVQDGLGGKSLNCNQCGASINVPASVPRPTPMGPMESMPASGGVPMESGEELANKWSWYALLAGAASIVCNCLTGAVSVLFAIKVFSKPGATGGAKARAAIGAILAVIFTIGGCAGLMMLGRERQKEREADLAKADRAYEEKKWDEAKPIYEKWKDDLGTDVKPKCYARLGRIAFAEGNKERARELFRKAQEAKRDYDFTCEDPAVMDLWNRTKSGLRRESGDLGFETEVKGPKRDQVSASGWTIEGKQLAVRVSFKSDPKKLRVYLVLYGANEVRLKEYNWDRHELDRSEKLVTPVFDGEWDDVRRAILYVEAR